jgi:DNA-binding Lrp family transcriptional regulator
MGDTSRGAIEFFIDKTKLIKEVDICWELNGSWDFVLRLHVEEEAQFEPLRRTINDLAISGFKIVRRTQSFLIAAFVKGNLPIEALSISPPDKEHDT